MSASNCSFKAKWTFCLYLQESRSTHETGLPRLALENTVWLQIIGNTSGCKLLLSFWLKCALGKVWTCRAEAAEVSNNSPHSGNTDTYFLFYIMGWVIISFASQTQMINFPQVWIVLQLPFAYISCLKKTTGFSHLIVQLLSTEGELHISIVTRNFLSMHLKKIRLVSNNSGDH